LGKGRGALGGGGGVLTEGFGGRFDGEARPAAVKLVVGQVEVRRNGTKGSTRCGDERRCERTLLLAGLESGGVGRWAAGSGV
jgi:hypothetical protein